MFFRCCYQPGAAPHDQNPSLSNYPRLLRDFPRRNCLLAGSCGSAFCRAACGANHSRGRRVFPRGHAAHAHDRQTDPFFAPDSIRQILSAGWGAISYRQNTELFVQAWHWNPRGAWSDPAGKGYFTGDANPTEMIRHSYGYSLPHRGFTRNQGSEDDGYSRLTDGDPSSYWKSNPYLTHRFTQEDDALHPQWIVIDLGSAQSVNAIRIAWAEPYAKLYRVEYWVGTGDAMDEQGSGDWKLFPSGNVIGGHGGDTTLRLIEQPMQV